MLHYQKMIVSITGMIIMNFSIISLRTSLLSASPLVSENARVYCSEIYATRFGFSFIFSPSSLILSNSRFEHFLHTSLVLTQTTTYTGLYTSRPSQPSSGDVVISNAVFNGCSSSTSGGAIYQSGGALTLVRTTFISCFCTAEVLGGALEAEGTSASVSFCCGYGCYTPYYGQLMRIVLSSDVSTTSVLINYTSSLLCAPSQINPSYESIITAHGYNYYYYCNASSNHVAGQRAAFAPDVTIQAIIRFCSASNNVGTTTIRLCQSSQILDWCNLYNNTGHENGAGMLIELSGTSTISNCTFLKNGDYLFNGTGSASVYNCVFSNSDPSSLRVSLYSCNLAVSRATTLKLSEMVTYLCYHTVYPTSKFSASAPFLPIAPAAILLSLLDIVHA